jgi:hypothetical protein
VPAAALPVIGALNDSPGAAGKGDGAIEFEYFGRFWAFKVIVVLKTESPVTNKKI